MKEKYFSKKAKNNSFYLPGEEIKLNQCTSFSNYSSCNSDPVTTCKNRIQFAICLFLFVYSIISFRLINVCVSGNYMSEKDNQSSSLRAYAHNPIKRADILDRNGTIIATSLPTVNLYANPKKVFNPKKAAKELAEVLPELSAEDVYKKLTSKSTFVYLKRNLTPSQQYQINYLGIPGLKFENGEKRVYPQKNLFAHIIGNTNIDNIGLSILMLMFHY